MSQVTSAILYEYVREMGIDISVVTLASIVHPSSKIYKFSEEELDTLGINTDWTPGLSERWRLNPQKNNVVALVSQPQDGAGRVADLSISCGNERPTEIVLGFSVSDETIDWKFASISWSQPIFVDVEIEILENKVTSRWVERLAAVPAFISDRGSASFTMSAKLSDALRLMGADGIEVSAFESMALLRTVGDIRGRFGMASAPETIALALKNCSS